MKILHVLVVLVISPLGFRKCIYIQCCDQNKNSILFYIGGHWESECSPAFWAGHCVVHGYSPVVVLCSVLK